MGQVAGSSQPELVDDDGETLWASPTSGSPLKLDQLPAGAKAILVLRAAELAESVEGSKMIECDRSGRCGWIGRTPFDYRLHVGRDRPARDRLLSS